MLVPERNRLLAALPAEDGDRLFPQLDLIPLAQGAVLHEAGQDLGHAYFPVTSMVSMVYVMGNGSPTEIAAVGREGMIGVSAFMGGRTTPARALVTSGGYAFRIEDSRLRTEFVRFVAVQRLLLRYTQALLTQMAQTAVCNRHHSLEQQLCRWLLTSLDRLPSKTLLVTQKQISDLLGVRREGVTEAAGKLQDAGAIRYKRGQITVLNRASLEHNCCECYGVVRREFDRLLSASAMSRVARALPSEDPLHTLASAPLK